MQALLRLVAGKQIPELSKAAASEDYVVEREKHERTDVAVYCRKQFAIFIENKVHASKRADQVKDMIKELVKLADAQQIPVSCRFGLLSPMTAANQRQNHPGKSRRFDASNLKPLSRVEVFGAFHQVLKPANSEPTFNKPPFLLPERSRSITTAMKIKELDSSHRCLLENLDTYRKMKTSYEEDQRITLMMCYENWCGS